MKDIFIKYYGDSHLLNSYSDLTVDAIQQFVYQKTEIDSQHQILATDPGYQNIVTSIEEINKHLETDNTFYLSYGSIVFVEGVGIEKTAIGFVGDDSVTGSKILVAVNRWTNDKDVVLTKSTDNKKNFVFATDYVPSLTSILLVEGFSLRLIYPDKIHLTKDDFQDWIVYLKEYNEDEYEDTEQVVKCLDDAKTNIKFDDLRKSLASRVGIHPEDLLIFKGRQLLTKLDQDLEKNGLVNNSTIIVIKTRNKADRFWKRYIWWPLESAIVLRIAS